MVSSNHRPPIIVLLLGWILKLITAAVDSACIVLWLLPRLWLDLTVNFVMHRPKTTIDVLLLSFPRLFAAVGYPFILLAQLSAAILVAISMAPPSMALASKFLMAAMPAFIVTLSALYHGAKLAAPTIPPRFETDATVRSSY